VSAAGRDHPARLLWYAAGRLEPGEAETIGRHVVACAACAEEVEGLRSMFRSIREQSEQDHVSCADLLAYHDRDPALDASHERAIEAHVSECHQCADDLAVLERATIAEGRATARSVGDGRRAVRIPVGVLVAVAAATLAVSIVAVGIGGWRPAAISPPPAGAPQFFTPLQRGSGGVRRLTGLGPWPIRVLLPLDAPRGAYDLRIRRADGTAELLHESIVEISGDRLLVEIPRLPAAGHYLLELVARDPAGHDPFLYGFEAGWTP
jgi:hypothetical protein